MTLRKKPLEYNMEKEKMLETNTFSFSKNVFFPIQKHILILNYIHYVICICLQFGAF